MNSEEEKSNSSYDSLFFQDWYRLGFEVSELFQIAAQNEINSFDLCKAILSEAELESLVRNYIKDKPKIIEKLKSIVQDKDNIVNYNLRVCDRIEMKGKIPLSCLKPIKVEINSENGDKVIIESLTRYSPLIIEKIGVTGMAKKSLENKDLEISNWYEGQIRENKPNGYGIYADAENSQIGTFFNGNLHGENCILSNNKNGSSFVGEFKDGKKVRGIFHDQNFCGFKNWKSSWLNGEEILVEADHLIFTGYYKNDQFQGWLITSNCIIEGIFNNDLISDTRNDYLKDKLQENFTITYPNDTQFIGTISQNEKYCVILWKRGKYSMINDKDKQLCGKWSNNNSTCKGYLLYNGNKFYGKFSIDFKLLDEKLDKVVLLNEKEYKGYVNLKTLKLSFIIKFNKTYRKKKLKLKSILAFAKLKLFRNSLI